jgi:2-methylcitrate dehydratase
MDNTIRKITDFAFTFRFEDIPPHVVHDCKRRIIDAIGCAFGAHDAIPARIARSRALSVSSPSGARFIGASHRSAVEHAAFANGVMIRYLDGNDTYSGGGAGHPSDVLGVAPNIALYQTRIGNVSMWKGCAYANASRNAVFATMLAARGMTGPAPVFEGVGGYFKAVSRTPFELARFGDRGQPFKLMECSIKRFPLGQYSQTVVEAALQLRSKVSGPDEIAEVRIETVTTAIVLMAGDPDKWEPKTRESADHSMPYTVAVALVHGEVEEKHFGERYLNDPVIRGLTRRVKAKATAEADARMPAAMLCRMVLVTTGGQSYETAVEYHKGHWKNPMADAEIETKFRKLSKEVLDEPRTDRLLESLWGLEKLGDAGEIVRLTQAGSKT